MRVPPNTKMGGAGVITPSTRPNDQKAANDKATVQQLALNFENNRVPAAWASQYAPTGRRTWWHLAFKCPHGCAGHFARSPERIEDGFRRAGCGRLVWLIIARTYRNKVVA